MSITVVKYKCSNPASISLKQAKNNAITDVPQGMPQKFRFADGENSFSLGRAVYTNAPQCHSVIKGGNPFTSIRVDSQAGRNCNKTLPNTGWSHTRITIPGKRRNALYANTNLNENTKCCTNGKMTIVASSDEYIERKKNRAIGKGSSTVGLMNKQGNNQLSFQGITEQMTATQARRKVRNSGYVVPPKCRGGGDATGSGTSMNCCSGKCGQPTGWAVTPLFGK